MPTSEQLPAETEASGAQGPRGEVSAAEERSRKMKRQRCEWLYEEIFWPRERAFLWLAFRDPARFEDNFRPAMLSAHLRSLASLKDGNPRRTLLRALQEDKLRAIKDGKELPPEAWAAAGGLRWPEA